MLETSEAAVYADGPHLLYIASAEPTYNGRNFRVSPSATTAAVLALIVLAFQAAS
jgi:hypothetical protein